MKLAGTIWAVVTRSVSMSRRALGGVPLGHDHHRAPLAERHLGVGGRGHVVAGAAHEVDVVGPKPQNVAKGFGGASRPGRGGAVRAIPLGRPVVPEV